MQHFVAGTSHVFTLRAGVRGALTGLLGDATHSIAFPANCSMHAPG